MVRGNVPVDSTGQLEVLHGDIAEMGLVPGWNRPGNPPLWDAPKQTLVPSFWQYEMAKSALARAGTLVGTEFAERRNLIMVNPTPGNHYPTTRSHVLAYQMLLPGERARTHRHSPHAGRLVLDADEGTYTVIDGFKIPLKPGDVLLTPGGCWHGHGHSGNAPAFWIDFLDAPLVQLLEPMFFEPYPGDWQAPTQEGRDSPLLFSYDESLRRLDGERPHLSGYFGRRIELGSPALPTIGLFMHQLDPGYVTRPLRTTANYVYCVVEGSGTSIIDDQKMDWSRGDVVAAPCWRTQQHASESGAVLLAVTDEPLQRYCRYLRVDDDITFSVSQKSGALGNLVVQRE